MAKIFGSITLQDNQAVVLNNSANSFAISLKAPSALGSNLTINLPGSAGSSGQSLITDGSGNLSFAARVQGPGSAVDNAAVRFDGTTGSLVQSSSVSISDTGQVLAPELALSNSGFAISLVAPTLAASYSLTLPADDGASGQVLQTNGSGVLSWATPAAGISKAADTWETADGTTFVFAHGLGTSDVQVSVIDLSDDLVIQVQDIEITDSNTVTLTSSSAPGASGFRVVVLG